MYVEAEGRYWEGNRLRISSNVICKSLRRLCDMHIGQVVVSVHRDTSHMPRLSTYSSSAQSAHMHIHSPREHVWLKSAQLRMARIGVLKK